MRIAILDPSCLNWLYTHNLCQALANQGCEVHAVASPFVYVDGLKNGGNYKEWNHFYNLTTALYRRKPRGFLRRYVKGMEHLVNMLTLPRLLKSLKPDIIHYQQSPLPLFDRWMLGPLGKIAPLVSTVHNTDPFHGDDSRLQRIGFRSLLSHFDHLIAQTEYSRKRLIMEFGLPTAKISVIPGGLYDHYEELARPSSGGPVDNDRDRERIILLFGNLSFYKGPDLLIRAFAKLPQERLRKTRLLICGHPQMSIETLKGLARHLGVEERITWDLRFLPEEDVHDIFVRSDIVALPYRNVDRSALLLTTLKYGKPFVAFQVGGFAEILKDGVHGCLAQPEDTSAFAVGLETILSDTKKASEMGKAVRELGEKWSTWDEAAKETLKIYKNLQRRGGVN